MFVYAVLSRWYYEVRIGYDVNMWHETAIQTAAAGKSTIVADGWAPAHVRAVKGAIQDKLGRPTLITRTVPQCGMGGQV